MEELHPACERILPGLYSIALGPVNAFFIDDPAGGILIDTGFPDKAPVILKALADIGEQPSDICHILLTPPTRTTSAALQKATGAQTYAHPVNAPLIRVGTGWPKLIPTPGLLNLLIVKFLVRPAMQVEPTLIHYELMMAISCPSPAASPPSTRRDIAPARSAFSGPSTAASSSPPTPP